MLADKARSASQTAAAATIEYVGGYTEGFVGSASDIVITFGGNLTGGLASSASEGDLVIVYFGIGSDQDPVRGRIQGYNDLGFVGRTDTQCTGLLVSYKIMGPTPDTTFTLDNGTLDVANAGAVAVQVWRNVDTDLFQFTTASASNSVLCNPPAITPVATGSYIIAGGAGGHFNGTQTFSSSDLTGFISSGANDSEDVTVGLGYHQWTSGAFDPAAFTFSGTDSTSYSWAALTLVLRPAGGQLIEFIASASTVNSTSSSTLVIDKPSGTAENDLMVAVMAADDSTNWSGDTGWTEVGDSISDPDLRIAYKVASSSEPANYTFSLGSTRTNVGCILTYRGAVYDAIGSFNAQSTLNPTGPTASEDLSVVLVAGACDVGAVFVPPDNTVAQVNIDAADSLIVASRYVYAGATGSFLINDNVSEENLVGIALTIKPS